MFKQFSSKIIRLVRRSLTSVLFIIAPFLRHYVSYSTQKKSSPQIISAQKNQQQFRLDGILLLSYCVLLMIGLIMVASSSMIAAETGYASSLYFFWKQFIFACIAMISIPVALFIPTRIWNKLCYLWLAGGFLLLILVLVPGIGHEVNGSRRWLRFGPIALQVSEFIKLCGVMYVASFLARHQDALQHKIKPVLTPLAVLCAMAGLLLLEPDFGATMVLFTTALGIMFMAGVRVRWFIIIIALGSIAVVALILFSPYRLARLTGFLHPWKNQFNSGYQLTQSLIAFGRGGWFGVGLGNSIQKLFYLPEAHTDFILAIFAEEFGLAGISILLLLYGFVVWRGLSIANQAQKRHDLFEAYAAYGITFWLGLQVIVNVGVNIGLLPTKGLTLPFISYGGSSLLANSFVIGLLLRIDYQSKRDHIMQEFDPHYETK